MEIIFNGQKEHELELPDESRIKDVIEECRANLLKGDQNLFVMNGTM